MRNRTQQMHDIGQSTWLDFISRSLLDSGELQRMVRDEEITGLTSNPTIFDKALAASDDYNGDLEAARAAGITDPYEAFVRIATVDLQRAADVLRPVWERTRGVDGYVSLEIPPGIESDVDECVAEGKRLFALLDRPNVMIKVPGTPEGVQALEALIAAGVNVNQTLLFDTLVYEASAEAYISGLEHRAQAGLPVDRPASVASFFVSRLDTAVDAQLPEGALRGQAAVANARDAYWRFQQLFSGPRWTELVSKGARVQRPLWASTGTKNPEYSDVLYVASLIAPDTVNTLPEATLRAVLDHADVRAMTEAEIDDSRKMLQALAMAGIDMRDVTARLLVDGLDAFDRDFQSLLERIRAALAAEAVGGA